MAERKCAVLRGPHPKRTVRTERAPCFGLVLQDAASQLGEALRELASEFEPPDDSGSAGGGEGGSVAGARESIDERADDDVRAVGSMVTMQVRRLAALRPPPPPCEECRVGREYC